MAIKQLKMALMVKFLVDQKERKVYNMSENIQIATAAAAQDMNNNKQSVDSESAYQQNMPTDDKSQAAYKEAYAAYKYGANNDNKDNPVTPETLDQAKNNQGLAYDQGTTYHATQDGVSDARNNNSEHAKDYTNNDNQQAAYNNAKAAYQAGFNQQDDSSAVDKNQGSSYNLGRAAQAAIEDASSGKYNNDPDAEGQDESGHWSSRNENNSKDSAYTNNDQALPWTNPQKQEYDDAYRSYIQGQNDAKAKQEATKAGITDEAGNKDFESQYSASGQAIQVAKDAYQNARDAYKAGYQNDDSYIATAQNNDQGDAYNQGRAARAAVKDAENGINNATDAQNNPNSFYNNDYRPGTIWNAAQKQAYQDAFTAYQDGQNSSENATNEPDTVQNKAYKDGQNDKVVKQAVEDAVNGITGITNVPTANADVYKNAQTNYQAGFDNPTKTNENNDFSYQTGQTARKAIIDATKNTNNINQYSGENKVIYQIVQNNYQDGLAGKPTHNENPTDPGKSEPYSVGQAAKQAIYDATNGNQKSADDSTNSSAAQLNNGDASDRKAAYDNAKNAYNAGLDNNLTNDDQKNAQLNPTANQAGQAAYRGINDAINGHDKTNGQSTDYSQAYDNAKDGLDGQPKHSESNNNVAYQTGKAYNTGINDEASGNTAKANDPNNPDNDSKNYNSTQKQAYDQAKKDYSDGVNGNTIDNSGSNINPNSKGYQQGVTAKDDANAMAAGINDESDGNEYKADDPKNPNQTAQKYTGSQIDAYNNAKTDYISGYNAPADSSGNGQSQAYQAGQAAKKGVMDAQKGDITDDSYTNPTQQAAYNKAQNDYVNGNESYGQPSENNGIAYQTGRSDDEGVRKALKDPSDDKTNHNAAYQATRDGMKNSGESAFYKSHQLAYDIGNATKQAIDDANNGDTKSNGDTVYNGQPTKALIYSRAKNDYIAGLTGSDNAAEDIDHNSVSYRAGSAAKAGIADATIGKHTPPTDNNFDTTAYDNAQKAYQAGLDNNTTSQDKTDAQLNPIANNAGMNTKQGIHDAITGHPDASQYSQNTDYHNAYDNAKNGMQNNGQNKDTIAYQSGQAEHQGIIDAQTGQKHAADYNHNSIAIAAYSNAKNAYNDGTNGDNDTSNAKADPIANEAGQAARDGINDAIHDNSDSADKYQHDPAAANAYQNAKKAYQAGLNGDTTSDNAKANAEANAAGQATRDGIHDAEQGSNSSAPKYKGNKTATDAYQKAKQAYQSGLNGDTTSKNATNSPEANKAGQATRDGIHDAQNGNTNAANKYANDSNANNAYQNAQKSYAAGQKGDKTSPAAKANVIANQAGANDHSNADQEAAAQNEEKQGSKAFINGYPDNSDNPSYKKGYDRAKQGFDDGMNNRPKAAPNDDSYNTGYQAAKDYQKGASDASHDDPRADNGSYAYNDGYNAYENGTKGEPYNNDNMNPSYQKAYKQAYNNGNSNYMKARKDNHKINRRSLKQDRKNQRKAFEIKYASHEGYKHGMHLDSPAKLRGFSRVYKHAYMKAYVKALRLHIPRYVYNLKKIYRHNEPSLTARTRNAEYTKTLLRNRHEFKVRGYGFTPAGHLIFRVKGGWISAAHSSIADLYYRHNAIKHNLKVKVIRERGTYIYNSKHFNHNSEVRYLRTGKIINIKSVEKVGHITRFYLGHGRYLSSNKTIVKKVG
ncbi:DUF5776 domain-containing protein [Apilactobacillus micheneri]|nr:DUF5776 domain-containing protein [Apilactobacillus micheneri]